MPEKKTLSEALASLREAMPALNALVQGASDESGKLEALMKEIPWENSMRDVVYEAGVALFELSICVGNVRRVLASALRELEAAGLSARKREYLLGFWPLDKDEADESGWKVCHKASCKGALV